MGNYNRRADLASAAGTEELIWNKTGAYVLPVAAARLEISSTDVKDVIGGVGARTALIGYLDDAYKQKREIVRLGDYATNKVAKGNGSSVTVGKEWKNYGKHSSLSSAGNVFTLTPAAQYDGLMQDADGATIAIVANHKYMCRAKSSTAGAVERQLGFQLKKAVPVNQVETATIVGAITVDGNARVVVTGALISGSPITRTIALTSGDDASAIAGKIIADLQGVSAITDIYTVGGSTDKVTLTSILDTTNDPTLNISVEKGTCVGLTDAPTSANTTAGAAVVAGQYQVETAVVAGTCTKTGDCMVIVTGALVAGSPLKIPVAVTNTDTAAQMAGKIRTAMNIAAITDNYTVGGADENVTLTAKAKAADDTSLNISVTNVGSCAGLVDAANSANTRAGVAPVTGQNQVETATVIGTITLAGNAKITVTGTLLSTNPQIQPVAVGLGDDAETIADKIKTALGLVTDITDHYTIGGTGADVTLTTKEKLADDNTLNIAVENDTCTGITDDTSSANTTAGILHVDGVPQIETATAAGTITANGNVNATLTSALTAGSPLKTLVAVTAGDDPAAIATKIRSALNAVGAITTDYTIGGTGADILITAKVAAADDASLNLSLDKNQATGITDDTTSDNTTAGIAANAGAYQVETATVAGTITKAGDCSVIITSANVAGSPLLVPVALAAADAPADIATKIKTALGLVAAITTPYTVGGTGADVTLTDKAKQANDNTLNISITKAGTCVGLTDDTSSTDTTAGVSSIGRYQVETAAVVGTITKGGKAIVTIDDNNHPGSPFEILVDVAGTKQVETATLKLDEDFMKLGGNATVITTCTGMTNSPKTLSVALAGTKQVETATVAGTITSDGYAVVDITASNLRGRISPVRVDVVAADDASAIATKIRTALGLITNLTDLYTVGGSGVYVSLTAKKCLANDATLNISIVNGSCAGITNALTSANTTPGVAGDTLFQAAAKIRAALVADADIGHASTGYLTIGGSGDKITLTTKSCLANIANLNLSIADGTCDGITTDATSDATTAGVVGDTAAQVGGKIRAAMALYSTITDNYDITGSNETIILTAKERKANDTTLNIAIDNYTCTGLTAAPTSTNTTTGIADGEDITEITNFDDVSTTDTIVFGLATAAITAATAVLCIFDVGTEDFIELTLDDIMLVDITALEYDQYSLTMLKAYFDTFIASAETTKRTMNADIFRVNEFKILSTGSELDPAGNISLKQVTGVGTDVYAYIKAGELESEQLIFTVPAGMFYKLEQVVASTLLAAGGIVNDIIIKSNYSFAGHYLNPVLGYVVYKKFTIKDNSMIYYINGDIFPPTTDIMVMTSGSATAKVNVELIGSMY